MKSAKQIREEKLIRYELLLSKAPIAQNTVINKFNAYTEVVNYKRDFAVFDGANIYADLETGEIVDESVVCDRSANFAVDQDGTLIAIKDGVGLQKLLQTQRKQGLKAQDNFVGYAKVNKWQYFVTVTIDPGKWGTEDHTRRELWKKFVMGLQYRFKDVKVLAVQERHHEPGANKDTLHFHALVADADIDATLTKARDPNHFGLLTTKSGAQIYNTDLWKFGYSTVVKISQNQKSYERVTNYLIKYVTKSNQAGYRQKRYYHTRNVEFKQKRVEHFSVAQMHELSRLSNISNSGVKKYKDIQKLTVYHVQDPAIVDRIMNIRIADKDIPVVSKIKRYYRFDPIKADADIPDIDDIF